MGHLENMGFTIETISLILFMRMHSKNLIFPLAYNQISIKKDKFIVWIKYILHAFTHTN